MPTRLNMLEKNVVRRDHAKILASTRDCACASSDPVPCAKFFRLLGLAAILFCLFGAISTLAEGFTASLDRDAISLGESAVLSLTFEGGQPASVPNLPSIPNLQAFNQGTSSQVSVVNGSVSSTETLTFALTPSQPGDYTIPAMTVSINGHDYSSQPVKLKVVPAGSTPATATGNNELAFLKLFVPKNEVYVGEVFRIELDLYLRNEVKGVRSPQLEPIEATGFTVGKVVEGQRRQAQVGNNVYTVIPLIMSATAVKAGKLPLGPAGLSTTLMTPPLDWFGQPTHAVPITLHAEPITVDVQPVPTDHAPPTFNGAVGSYTMNVTVTPTNVAVGDPITVKVEIQGRGAVNQISLPDQANWQQFKMYPPTSDFQTADQFGMDGAKTFALTVVPQSLDVKELPSFAFSYFDPDQKAFRTLTQPATPLIIRPSASSMPPPIASSGTTDPGPKPARDIAPIKVRLGEVTAQGPPLAMRPWFVALQGVPVAAFAFLLVGRKRRERLVSNPRLRRQMESERRVREGMRELRAAANANEREKFFAALFHVLQEQIGSSLDVPASAITESVVQDRLRPRNLPESVLQLIQELFQACNQYRYARVETREELVSMIQKTEGAIGELRKIQV